MSKIAIVGCDSSGKTVFVSALTDFFKAGQRIGQACALRAADSVTLNYTNQLHHRMRIQGRWPERTPDEVEDARRLKWEMVTVNGPLTEIEMLDFAGENFRRAFNGQRDNAAYKAAVGQLVDYIAQADYIVITVGLRNMIRRLRPELYEGILRSEAEYQRDEEAQWVTTELLKLVANKMRTNPLSVVVALTQADQYRQELEDYGAKGLFAKCWSDIAMFYPNLNVVSVASVDKVTAQGQPAKGYQTHGVLTVMKEFSRFAFGDCDEVTSRLDDLTRRLSNMADVGSASDFSELTHRYETAIEELKTKTVIIQELYKEEVRSREAFLDRCRLFEEVVREVERRPSDIQSNEGFWADQSRVFADFAGTVRGYTRFYQRKVELARLEAEQRAEKARRDELARQEAARRAEQERKEAEAKRLTEEKRAEVERREKEARRAEEVKRIMEERQAEAERKRREAEAVAAEKARQLELQRQAEKLAQEKSEREERERREKNRAFVIRSVMALVALLILGVSAGAWYSRETARKELAKREEREALAKIKAKQQADHLQQVRLESERAKNEAEARKMEARQKQAEAELALAQEDAKVKDKTAQLELARLRAKEAEEARLAAKEAEARREKEAEASRRREAAKFAESQIESLRKAVSADDLEESRKLIASLRRGPLTSKQNGIVKFCEQFCSALERALNGDDTSQMWIALQHASQVTTVAEDKVKARLWYERAAELGNVQAMMKLAAWSEQGVGAPRNLRRAVDWYEMAAATGSVDAMMKLALLSEKGVGIEKSESQAVAWYERAAEAKCGNAYYWLGVYNAKGTMGMPKSIEKAHELFLKAKQYGCTYSSAEGGVDAWIRATKVR